MSLEKLCSAFLWHLEKCIWYSANLSDWLSQNFLARWCVCLSKVLNSIGPLLIIPVKIQLYHFYSRIQALARFYKNYVWTLLEYKILFLVFVVSRGKIEEEIHYCSIILTSSFFDFEVELCDCAYNQSSSFLYHILLILLVCFMPLVTKIRCTYIN